MRNLKRLLALTLSALLTAGSLSVGASAAGSVFTDADQITHTEAVEVMTGLGVFSGSGGAFHPNDILTREQAAKLICHMVGAQDEAAGLSSGVRQFDDVDPDRWSAPYIAYCVQNNILSGDGSGLFYPEQTLSGAAFAKMLLVALGYDPAAEGFTGTDWLLNVASAAQESGLAGEDLNLLDGITRQDAALLCYRVLTCNMVRYDGVNDLTQRPSAVRVDGYFDRDYNGARDGVQQFCEAYFPDLVLATSYDAFGRPGSGWQYEGQSLSYTPKTPTAVFSLALDARQVASALSVCSFKSTELYEANVRVSDARKVSFNAAANLTDCGSGVRSTQSACWIDGQTTAGFLASLTGNGRQVEIYTGEKNVITDIVVVHYQSDTLSGVYTDGGYTVYTIGSQGYVDYHYSTDDTAVVHGMVQSGQTVTYAVADGVAHIYPTRRVVGAVTALDGDTVEISGTDYPLGTAVSGLPPLSVGDEGVFCLDQAGSVVDFYAGSAFTGYALLLDAEGVLNLPAGETEPAQTAGQAAEQAVPGQPAVTVSLVASDGTVGQYSVALRTLTAADLSLGGPYGKNGALGPEASNNPAGVAQGGAGYVSDQSVTLEVGDVVIAHTDILVYDASADGTGANGRNTAETVNRAAALTGVWACTLQGDTADLYPLPAATGEMTPWNLYQKTGVDVSAMGASELTDGHYALSLDSKTRFVIYDAAAQQAVCYEGMGSLPASVPGMENVSVVIRAVTAGGGGAAVVFARAN